MQLQANQSYKYSVQNDGTIYKGLYNSAFFSQRSFQQESVWFLKRPIHYVTATAYYGGWTAALEKGGQINTIYADFEKAFDKVPHHLLLKKIAQL